MSQKLIDLQDSIRNKQAAILFFNTDSCAVGEQVDLKLQALLKRKYPKIKFYAIQHDTNQEIAHHFSLFTFPALIIFFEGKEFFKKSGTLSINEIETVLNNYYPQIFE